MAKRQKTRKHLTMSAELKAMLDRPRTGPIRPVNRVDDAGKTAFFGIDTRQQLKLYAAANRILAKSGYFQTGIVEAEDALPEATMIGRFGLRPIWHGRA